MNTLYISPLQLRTSTRNDILVLRVTPDNYEAFKDIEKTFFNIWAANVFPLSRQKKKNLFLGIYDKLIENSCYLPLILVPPFMLLRFKGNPFRAYWSARISAIVDFPVRRIMYFHCWTPTVTKKKKYAYTERVFIFK